MKPILLKSLSFASCEDVALVNVLSTFPCFSNFPNSKYIRFQWGGAMHALCGVSRNHCFCNASSYKRYSRSIFWRWLSIKAIPNSWMRMQFDEVLCRIIVLLCLSCIKPVKSVCIYDVLQTKHVLHRRCEHRSFDQHSTRRRAINDIHNHQGMKTKTTDVNQHLWVSSPDLSTPKICRSQISW